MNQQKRILIKNTVFVKKDFVIRDVECIDDAKKILAVLDSIDNIGCKIIDTSIVENKVLKHRKLKHIIHSGEYTESMAYDVVSIALNLALKLVKKGVYSYDLHPHNFTFENGDWILIDFGSFTLSSKNVKTQIRSAYKIAFAGFELLKRLSREEQQSYFLNRIKHSELFQMISLCDWLKWTAGMFWALWLCEIKFHKQAFKHLIKTFNRYNCNYKKNIYNFSYSNIESELFRIIDQNLQETSDIFCIGKFPADWALYSNQQFIKTVYIDDYELCDEYYNYIRKNNVKGIAVGVLQPLTEDYNISDFEKYRALYDNFTCERMKSDTVILDVDEAYDNIYSTIEEFCTTILKYAEKNLIALTSDDEYTKEITDNLSKYFKEFQINKINGKNILILKNKLEQSEFRLSVKYDNANRMPKAKLHSETILKILAEKKHSQHANKLIHR